MENINEIFAHLTKNEILVFIESGKLKVKAEHGALTSELRAYIQQHREQIVSYLETQSSSENGLDFGPIEGVMLKNGETFELSHAQERMWFIDKYEGKSANYNLPAAFRLSGSFNVAYAEKSLKNIIERHEAIRTVFIEKNNRPVQKINYLTEFFINVIDLSALDKLAQEQRLLQQAISEQQYCFDLTSDLMLRVTYINLSQCEGALLFNMHHIAADGWSMNVLMKEFVEEYQACVENRSSDITLPAIQYRDFAKWQRNLLSGSGMESKFSYWDEKLKNLPELHSMTLDFVRPPEKNNNGKRYNFSFSEKLSRNVSEFIKTHNVTSFMFFHAVYALLIARHGRSNDVVIGAPIAGRNQLQFESLIGLFSNTVVLRTDVSGDSNFLSYLNRIKQENIAVLENQEIQFDALVDRLNPARSTAYTPLVQLIISMQGSDDKSIEIPGISLVPLTENESSTSKFDLAFNIATRGGLYEFFLDYDTSLFSYERIFDMALHIQYLTEQIIEKPTMPINLLSLNAPGTKPSAILSANVVIDNDCKSISQIFEHQASKFPVNIALSLGESSMTYEELNGRANQLARYLLDTGVTKEDMIGLMFDRSFEMIIAILAVLKAGAAYVPMEPTLPVERINYILKDCAISKVLCMQKTRDAIQISTEFKICVDDINVFNTIKKYPKINIDSCFVDIEPNNLAYVIYTSGSTGKPKGVMVEHQNVTRLFACTDRKFDFTENDVWTLFHSYSFDFSVWEIMGALFSGARLVIIPAEVAKDSEAFLNIIEKEKVTCLSQTPSAFYSLASKIIKYEKETCLRYIVFGGEKLEYYRLENWFTSNKNKKCKLINMYGITETTVHVTFHLIEDKHIRSHKDSIGKPLDDISIYVCDENMSLQPRGVYGELYVGGSAVTRGYLNNELLNKERFCVSPFGSIIGERLYKTGDIVRLNYEGDLEYYGRNDSQVKVRGFRIELGEIELALLKHEDVVDAVIDVRPAQSDSSVLVAYVVSSRCNNIVDAPNKFSDDDLRRDYVQFLRTLLPEYMVPMVYVFVDEIPTTENEKRDIKSLRGLADKIQIKTNLRTGYLAPSTQLESELCEMMQSILHVERIGIDDDFFSCGGHSLLAAELISVVRERYNIEVSLKAFFSAPKVKSLASLVESGRVSDMKRPLLPVDKEEYMDTSAAQQRMWLVSQLESASRQYNIVNEYRISGDLNLQLFKQAIELIVAKHESLRTNILMINGDIKQKIKASVDVPFVVSDLSGLCDKERIQKEAEIILLQEKNFQFNLACDTLFRIHLIKKEEYCFSAIITIHHIITDARSMDIFNSELGDNYNQLIASKEPAIKPLSICYTDYAVWQNAMLKSDQFNSQSQYWHSQLENVPTLHSLPLDKNRPAQQSYDGDMHVHVIDSEIVQAIHNFCRVNGITTFMFMQTVFTIFLVRYSGQLDVVMSTSTAGRNHNELDSVIGFFINELVLRSRVSSDDCFSSLLEKNRKLILDALDNQDVPFNVLVEQLIPGRALSYMPLAQIKLDLQVENKGSMALHGLTVKKTEYDNTDNIDYDLCLGMAISDQSIVCKWRYNTALFLPTTIARWANNICVLIDSCLKNTALNVFDLDIVSKKEKSLLLDTLNVKNFEDFENQYVDYLFQKSVDNHGDKIAIIDGNKSYSYRELNEKSNQFSRYLISRKAQENVERIALFMERSADVVIAMLGALKAKVPFVPIDVSLPEKRIGYILTDSACDLVFTHAQHEERLAFTDIGVVIIDDSYIDSKYPSSSPDYMLSSSNESYSNIAAYIIYTSGSTGTPKGVVVGHAGLINLIKVQGKYFSFSKHSKVLQFSSVSFDASIFECFLALMNGAVLSIVDEVARTELENVIDFIEESNITHALLPPVLLNQFCERKSTSLENLFLGGDALGNAGLKNAKYCFPNAKIYNLYGPTECSILSTVSELTHLNESELPNIGRPIDNTFCVVLDNRNKICPIGVDGELYIGGVNLACGYIGPEALTTTKFLAENVLGYAHKRLYKTGDIVRCDQNGCLVFIGRKDHQVKLNGYRIELGEIESLLLKNERLNGAIVQTQRNDQQELELVAYCKPENSLETITLNEICSYLSAFLPGHMIPAKFILVDEWPITLSGKIDRSKLIANDRTKLLGNETVKPGNVHEQDMCSLWSDILGVRDIGLTDNFFQLGGNSIAATRLTGRIRDRSEIEVPLRLIFENPTVISYLSALAKLVQKKSVLPVIQTHKIMQLSYAQKRLWFIDQYEGSSAQYNLPSAFRINGAFDVNAVEHVIAEIIRKHEVFRTNIANVNGNPQPIVRENFSIPFSVVDLSEVNEFERDIKVQEIVSNAARQPFDLVNDVLVRVKIIKNSDNDHILCLNSHHIAMDGWSINLLIKEFGLLYEEYISNNKFEFTSPDFQYVDYAIKQYEWLNNGELQLQLDYWVDELAGIPAVHNLPLNKLRPMVQTFDGELVLHQFNSTISKEIKSVCNKFGVTPYAFFYTAFSILIGRYSNDTTVVVGSPVSGRLHSFTENMIGLFLNTVVLKTDLTNNPTFAELLGLHKEKIINALERQDVPFDLLVDRLQPERSLAFSPLFQILFSMQNLESSRLCFKNCLVSPITDDRIFVKYDLELAVAEKDNRYSFTWAYNSSLFDRRTIETMSKSMEVLVAAVIDNPEIGIFNLDFLCNDTVTTLDNFSHGFTQDIPENQSIVNLIEKAVKANPEKTALKIGDNSISYSELNARANKLAWHIVKNNGVGNGENIAICLDRSIEMVVSVLAVIKARCSFVPMDPSYPVERLKYILNDSGVRLIISNEKYSYFSDQENILSVYLDNPDTIAKLNKCVDVNDERSIISSSLAYMIYTSGSTGNPKGVMVTHENLLNFFYGMSNKGYLDDGVWIAVTSLSFDISIFELLCPLAQGFSIIIAGSDDHAEAVNNQEIDFSLFFFASDEESNKSNKYELLLKSAEYGDQNEFSAIWTPERHFDRFGGLYPNPAITAAAIAARTKRIDIRAGSCVLPLHSPIRVAEDWSVIDNLSNGRAGVAFAAGWHPNDFAIAPSKYHNRRDSLLQSVADVQSLWKGNVMRCKNGLGEEIELSILPKPIQDELPIWITTGGNSEAFKGAGENGYFVLTHLLGQSIEKLAENISIYYSSRKNAGYDGHGKVTLMLHTFLADSDEEALAWAKEPFQNYIIDSLNLVAEEAKSKGINANEFNSDDYDVIKEYAFNRYFESSSLIGTPERCISLINKLKEINVTEIACLIDFGVSEHAVLRSLSKLNDLRKLSKPLGKKSKEKKSVGDLIKLHCGTHLQCTPSLISSMFEDDDSLEKLKGLQYLFVGGEDFPRALLDKVSVLKDTKVVNMYGPTETTIWSSTFEINNASPQICIGRPILNTQMYVVDSYLNRVPIGVAGELLIGGAGVTAGYWKRDELTKEKYISNPIKKDNTNKVYRTGDLVKQLDSGEFKFLGRLDNQVKIRGFRIEPGEIESTIQQIPYIKDCAVVVHERAEVGNYLVAFVVCSSDMNVLNVFPGMELADGLKMQLRDSLPYYMIPEIYVAIEQLPLTPNGKVDRKALKEVSIHQPKSVTYTPPQNSLQEEMCNIWQSLLGLEQVGIEDNFFILGGHSLLATRLISQVRQHFNIEIPLRVLFEFPTVAGFVKHISGAGKTVILPSIESLKENNELELSFAQRRLWFIDQLDNGRNLQYNVPGAFKISGAFNKNAFVNAIKTIIDRHEILRSSVFTSDGNPLVSISKNYTMPLEIFDLRSLSAVEQELKLQEIIYHDVNNAFDLSKDLPIRINLIQLDSDVHIVQFSIHHIASDGWSMGIFVSELGSLYEAYSNGKNNPLESLPIQYSDYARWQKNILSGHVFESQMSYWRRQLDRIPTLHNLPLDKQRNENALIGATLLQIIKPELNESIKLFCKDQDITLFMFLCTSLSLLFGRLSGAEDIVIGAPVSGRVHGDTEKLIGPFINTLILRTDLAGNPSIVELFEKNKKMILDAHDNQLVPFEMIVDDIEPERSLAYTPIFQILLTMQQNEASKLALNSLTLEGIEVKTNRIRFDLEIDVLQLNDGVSINWTYNTSIFQESSINSFSESYECLLRNILSAGNIGINDVELTSDNDRYKQLAEWNDTSISYENPNCIHTLIQNAAIQYPQSIAVLYEGLSIKFSELNAEANKLAHYLIHLGVKPGDHVVICLNRSPNMVLAILAVLKTGCAYVPVDPAYPEARLSYVLSDSRAVAVLTESGMRSVRSVTYNFPIVSLDDQSVLDAIAEKPDHNIEDVKNNTSDLAYIIYTSGSTGKPKGVMVEHQSVFNYIKHVEKHYLSEVELSIVSLPLAFDATVTTLIAPLCFGKPIELIKDDSSVLDRLIEYVIDSDERYLFKLTPAHLEALSSKNDIQKDINVRHIFVIGGEQLTTRSLAKWKEEYFPNSIYINEYGPTESTVGCSIYVVGPADNIDMSKKGVSIGKPIGNVNLYCLDQNLKMVPNGVFGELYISGDSLARGYLNQPALTMEKFIINPFSSNKESRLYKTGDRVRWLQSGNLEFNERVDHQVKIRGYRIELAEIEKNLVNLREVDQAVVIEHDQKLLAYIVADQEHAWLVRRLANMRSETSWKDIKQMRLNNGMVVGCLNEGETDFTYNEIFVEKTYLKGGITISNSDCILDVGANTGMFSLFVSKLFPKARIYAFEPMPEVRHVLEFNMALYDVNAQVFPYGISDKEQVVEFTYYPNNTLISGRYGDLDEDLGDVKSFLSNQYSSELRSGELNDDDIDLLLKERLNSYIVPCQMKALSQIIEENNIQVIDLLKLDVEKSEMDVLEAIKEKDWGIIKQFIVEIHDIGDRLNRLEEILIDKGFRWTKEQESKLEGSKLYVYYAINNDFIGSASEPGNAFSRDVLEGYKLCDEESLSANLKAALELHLPVFMIPQIYSYVSEIPLTTNGKVNRKLLLEFSSKTNNVRVIHPPRNKIESDLVEVWKETLGLQNISIDDSFFALGGDSIMSIQVVSRSRKKGIHFNVRQLFEFQSIAKLSSNVTWENNPRIDQELVQGRCDLIPVQISFFEKRYPKPHHYNQSLLLNVPATENTQFIYEFIEKLCHRHDALRLKFSTYDEVITSNHMEVSDRFVDQSVAVFDFSSMDYFSAKQMMTDCCNSVQTDLNFLLGNIFKVVYFRLSKSEARILFVFHHLVIDGVSWRIILNDLNHAWTQWSNGEKIVFPEKTTSFKRWAECLQNYSKEDRLMEQKTYWLEQIKNSESYISIDKNIGSVSRKEFEITLDSRRTSLLLGECNEAYRTTTVELLLSALLKSLQTWSRKDSICVYIEGHGREELFDGVDTSETVGWFTSVYPFCFFGNQKSKLDETIKNVKDQYRRIPGKGIGFGLLRYLTRDSDIVEAHYRSPSPQVEFNYLGQFESALEKGKSFSVATEFSGVQKSLENLETSCVVVNAMVAGDKFVFNVNADGAISDIDGLMKNLKDLLEQVADICAERVDQKRIYNDMEATARKNVGETEGVEL